MLWILFVLTTARLAAAFVSVDPVVDDGRRPLTPFLPSALALTAEEQEANVSLTFPISLPPWKHSAAALGKPKPGGATCVFYLEGLDLVIWNQKSTALSGGGHGADVKFASIPIRGDRGSPNLWAWHPNFVQCPTDLNGSVGKYSFLVAIDVRRTLHDNSFSVEIIAPMEIVLNFTLEGRENGYWGLKDIVVMQDLTVRGESSKFLTGEVTIPAGQNASSVRFMDLNGDRLHSWSCGSSQAAFFDTSRPEVKIGVALYNAKIGLDAVRFGNGTETVSFFNGGTLDCACTFTAGSWMGIIVAVLTTTAFIFAWLMLNDVHTPTRFDDPKKPQLVIEARG